MKTFGWDTVSLIDVASINSVLAARTSELRMRFNTNMNSEPTVNAVGEYSSWKVVPGGSGRLLYIALAIKNGTLSIGDGVPSPLLEQFGITRQAFEVKSYDLTGVTAVISIDLKLLNGNVGQTQELKFDASKVNYTFPPPGDGYVTPVTILDPEGKLNVAVKSLLGAVLALDLVQNADEVRFVFANINLVPPNSDSWLAPTASSYAYIDIPNANRSYLGVMSVTEGRSMEGLKHVIDPEDITQDFNASFIISGERILRKMILPILPEAYQTTPASFYFDEAQNKIRNTKPFNTFSVKSGAITYSPIIDFFEMRIDATGIRTTVAGRCDMQAGIWMSFSVMTWNQASFDPNTKQLTFLNDPNPVSSSDSDIPWYWFFLGPLVILITSLVVSIISKDIAGKLNDLLRTALAITQNPPKIVNWRGMEGFNVASAGLNDSLYMMGQSQMTNELNDE